MCDNSPMLNDRRKTLLSAASWLFTSIERKRGSSQKCTGSASQLEGWRALQSRHQMPVSPPPAASAACLWRKGPSSRASDCQMISAPGQMTPQAPATSPRQVAPIFPHASPDLGPAPPRLPLPNRGEQLRPHSWKPTWLCPSQPRHQLERGVPTACFQTFSPFFFFLYQFTSHCTC